MRRLLPALLVIAPIQLWGSARASEPKPTATPTPAAPVEAPAPPPATPADPATPDVAPAPSTDFTDEVPWALWLGGGLNLFFLEDTPLSDQLDAAGYTFDGDGPAFSLSLERYVLDWLVVGGTLDLRWTAGERDHPQLTGERLARDTMSLTRVGAGAYVQPTLCLLYESCRDDGIFFGAVLGVAFGPTFWRLRDATELGAFIRFDFALTWYFQVERFLLAMRVGHAMIWQSDLGPDELGHGFEWTPTIELRAGWRW
ncbi:MAG TPA: hypothetical protein PK095_13020 [Myxococcota bacterium]|nr:hypothetical protein [Myxococcota bacterium]